MSRELRDVTSKGQRLIPIIMDVLDEMFTQYYLSLTLLSVIIVFNNLL